MCESLVSDCWIINQILTVSLGLGLFFCCHVISDLALKLHEVMILIETFREESGRVSMVGVGPFCTIGKLEDWQKWGGVRNKVINTLGPSLPSLL